MTLPLKGVNQLRKGRVSIDGINYFVTKTTKQRLDRDEDYNNGILMSKGIPEIITGSLEWLHNKGHIHRLSDVIMPDHIHFLFTLGEGQELSKVMRRFFTYTSSQINQQLGRQGELWQSGYYDRALRNEEELEKAYRYILENPYKAGYVEEVVDWPWLYPQPLLVT